MKTAIIVQARMSSTRLPGKVLKPVLGKPLLQYLIERLQRVPEADSLIIATSIEKEDQPIVDLCREIDVTVFRGSQDDVLTRYYEAARQVNADIVVRVCSDCPLLDPSVVKQLIQGFQRNFGLYDYVSNCLQKTYPIGMNVEAFTFQALQEGYLEAHDPDAREHVTPFLYRNPKRYRLANLACPFPIHRFPRLTVDTEDDFRLIAMILETLYPANPTFGLEDIMALLDKHPDWFEINANVQQKGLTVANKIAFTGPSFVHI